MTIFTPARLDRLQRALVDGFEDATGVDAHWAFNRPSQETLPSTFVRLSMVSGPGPWIRKHRRGRVIEPIASVVLAIGPFADNARVGVVINGHDFGEDGSLATPVDDLRDAIVAKVNAADEIEPVTASAPAPGELGLTADFEGAIRTLEIYGPVAVDTITRGAGHVSVTKGTQTMVVNVEAFSKGREPRNGAWSVIGQCLAALQSDPMIELLRSNGVGVWTIADPVDLSAIAGAGWETRVGFDVTLATQAAWVQPTNIITTVTGTAAGEPFTAAAP